MTRRLAGQLVRGLVMVWVVLTFTFVIISIMPGDPVGAAYENLIQQGYSPDQAAAETAMMHRFQPTGNIAEQYLEYMGSLARFDLGQSMYTRVDVGDMLLDAAKWTVIPVLLGTILSFGLGVFIGVYAAIKRSSKLGDALTMSGSLLRGIPDFVVGLILAAIFATLWPVLPRSGAVDILYEPGFNLDYILSLGYHAILPVATYTISAYGGFILAMKSSVVTVLGDDFILAAELRGMKRSIIFRYIARNAILPLFTVFALSVAAVFSGAIFIERIFNYPGLGMLLINSIGRRDITVMAGALLLITIAVIIANIIADMFYSVIDPRIRRAGERV
ncbi:ABC transporter permease [Phytoactinopolyspora mesophila]|uniref:ABC transporter permease subunit n=1 Tax=Phytoactinopolyspora mesophila TaxID=2650750 RepID=A0A7K3M9F9_9ACTN|nr:ABC transporter permease [Phytoactinopolyspora mesophila]NDL59627.1 ABC transporter permease subunit [Phytoactinopolyspora mesophila]